jgi:hypothetical protein
MKVIQALLDRNNEIYQCQRQMKEDVVPLQTLDEI